MSNTPYTYDENAPELKAVKAEETAALEKSDKLFDDAIAKNNTEKEGILDQIDTNTQQLKDAQQEQTNLTIKEIEQNKDDTRKDYLKEQSGAWTDFQKQSNAYGVNAEQRAASGMQNTGYSESSQVSMYNAYQNRVAVARESYNRSVVSYNNAIAQAKAQNSVALAEIASEALAKSLEVTMNFATMNNNLLSQKASNRNQIASTYASKWAAVLDQLYKEAALAEQKRQHDETLAEQKRQFDILHGESSGGGSVINKSAVASKASETFGGSKITGDPLSKAIEGNKANKDNEKDYPVDTASLNACGLSGANAATIQAEIKAGRLVETVEDGKLTYRRVYGGGAINSGNVSKATSPNTKKDDDDDLNIFQKAGKEVKSFISGFFK